jgi:hypothetical protein
MDHELEFGAEKLSDIAQLRKALEVGYGTSPETQTGFGATRLESLEKTMKYAVEKEKASKFFIALKKGKADSTVEEFVTVNKLGSANFYVEGGLPEEYDEDIRREIELVKYVGAVGRVPNVAQAVKSLANNIAITQQNKAIAIVRTLDTECFFADSEKVPLKFNGFLTQFQKRAKKLSENLIDLEGNCITPETLNQIGQVIEGNYGDPMNIKGWTSIDAFQNYADFMMKNKYFFTGQSEVRGILNVPKDWKLANGSGELETDLHLKYKGQTHIEDTHPKLNDAKTAFVATHSKAPIDLVVGGGSPTASATVEDLAGSKLPADTYDYAVLAGNQFGVSAAVEILGVVVAANKKVVFTLTDSSPVGRQASFFEIYRKPSSKVAKTDYEFLFSVKASGTKEDTGSEIPGTTYSFFFDWDFDQVLTFKQLLPMVKMPLATIDDSVRWLQKLYGTPILFNPNKMVVLKNVGRKNLV